VVDIIETISTRATAKGVHGTSRSEGEFGTCVHLFHIGNNLRFPQRTYSTHGSMPPFV
jgi:hypothetical protein